MKAFSIKLSVFNMIVTAIVTLTTNISFAGADGSGGGSGIAAEITRSTNAFIKAVEENPQIFKGIDANKLRTLQVQILVTNAPLKTCDSSELDAWSDLEKGYSKFYLPTWIKKNDIDKIQLAGHERLVLLGYERSNQYDISNKIYEVQVKDLEKTYGTAREVCSFGKRACENMHTDEKLFEELFEQYGKGQLNANDVKSEVGELKILMRMQIIALESEKRSKTRSERALEKYTAQITLAFKKHFNSIFNEADRIISARPFQSESCVNLNGGVQ